MKTRILALLTLMGVLCTWAPFASGRPGAGPAREIRETRVFIGFRGVPGPAARSIVTDAGGTVLHSYGIVPALAAIVPEQALYGIARNPLVEYVEPDLHVWIVDYDNELDNSWGVRHIGSGEVHQDGNLGAGVKIAIVDTGIDYGHAELSAAYAGGYDFVNGNFDPMDDHGHGTMVAGVVSAARNGIGVVGVAPAATLYGLKVLGADGSGYWSDVVAAIDWSRANGIQIVNMSLGSSRHPGTTVETACLNAYQQGILLVAAAGNDGNPRGNRDTVGYPAKFDTVIAVSATDIDNERPSWSSTGPAVELAAPGVSIHSTTLNGAYATANGTSFSAPHVSGVAALVMSAYAGLSHEEVREWLQQTATDLGRPKWYGYGLVNAAAAALPPPGAGMIGGKVYDLFTGIPIASAKVTADTGDHAFTDSHGDYVISPVASGTRTVTAEAVGYNSLSVVAEVPEDGEIIVNFGLEETDESVTVSSVTYSGSGGRNRDRHLTITLSLENQDGQPVPGAGVVAVIFHDGTAAWTLEGITAANGEISTTLNNAPDGCYEIVVESVDAGDLAWDQATPPNSHCKG